MTILVSVAQMEVRLGLLGHMLLPIEEGGGAGPRRSLWLSFMM